MAEPGGTLVRAHHAAGDPAWFLSQRERTGRKNRRFRPALQSLPPALRLDGHSRLDTRQNHQTLFSYFRDWTLEGRGLRPWFRGVSRIAGPLRVTSLGGTAGTQIAPVGPAATSAEAAALQEGFVEQDVGGVGHELSSDTTFAPAAETSKQ